MNRFVHVGFAFQGVPKILDLEPVIGQVADDWIRYSTTSWILWTDKQSTDILLALMPALDPNDNFFISPIAIDESMGRLPPWIWEWFKRKGTAIISGAEADNALTSYRMLPKTK